MRLLKHTVVATLAASMLPFVACGQIRQRPAHPTQQELREMSSQGDKLVEFYRIMASNYLDTMNYEAVVEKGIVGMLAELDPHSVYLTAKEQQTSSEELGGGFSGIGIEFNTMADTIIVVNTIVGGPAEVVGLLPGDRIVTIDGKNAVGIERNDVPRYLRGPKGTKVEVGVFRRGTSGNPAFTITRDDIPINTVDAAYRPDPRTGYIKVNRFGATTGREFAEAFEKIGSEGSPIDGLILDLRGNGGGFLPEAIRMSEFFLDRGQRIVSTEGNMYPPQKVDAQTDGTYNRGRLVVLVDESSASASEIVAGAVQDWDRGVIVGRTTFGKGLVQREFPLSDGSAVRLTIAKYLTPTGRAIQRPYRPGHSDEYYREHIEMMSAAADSPATDSATLAAPAYCTMRSGRTVYGAGGIRPDIVIPADTAGYSPYWSTLIRTGRLREFVQSHLDDHRAEITRQFRDVQSYIDRFDATTLLSALADHAAAHGTERDPEGMGRSKTWIASQIKALIAQQLWETEGYYRVTHATVDDTFQRAHRAMLRWYETAG
ncbi:MAG: PDZ domain-containing protein, partial [Alistipes sp.]|nr:PDZ domain-containing protein [Alistipes sp.]